MAMEGITNRRLRLNFEDKTILTKTQKKLGLKRSWLLLKPHHHTISHLVYDMLDAFNLHHSCPHGILLTMDGFVLPPFESTTILKDKDLVSVKRKGLGMKAITEASTFIKDKIVDKQPLATAVKLLENEEFEKETGGYESESETDADEVEVEKPVQSAGGGGVAPKKRKASSPIEISKKKKLRQVSPESVQKKDIDHCENINSRQKRTGGSKNEVTVKSTKNSELRSESIELDEKKEDTVHASGVPNGAKKVCRSTRRKKKQRQWRRVGRTNNNEENEKKHPMKDLGKVSGITTNVDANNEQPDADDNLVRVHIRPGHIRFASASKANDVQKGQEANGGDVKKTQENGWVQKNQEANGWDVQPTQKSAWGNHSAQKNVWDSNKNKAVKETFSWNGIKNKRKGQKWGKENQPFSWKESRNYNGQSSNSRAIRNQPTPSWKQANNHNTQISSTWASRRKQPNDSSMEFEKLLPLIDSPKVGDIVAYRLLELSSSWCPELSSFRVGKITSFDQETNNIILVPEAEYPLNLERKAVDDHHDDDSGQPPQPVVYNEDGSLEIDFPSLVDVRIVKTAKPSHSGGAGVPTANDTPSSSGMSKSTNEVGDGIKKNLSDTGNQELHTPNAANVKKDVWEEMSEALSAKKAQFLQEDTWNKKVSSTTRSWSHRTLRSSAFGPTNTMPILRSQNGG